MMRGPTLSLRIQYYERHHLARKAGKTVGTQRFLLKAMRSELPDHPMVSDVQKWVTTKLNTWAESTVNAALKLGSHVCRFARDEWPDEVCPDPFKSVPKLACRKQKIRALPSPEKLFPELLRAQRDDLARAFLCVLFWHGLRRSEALGLEKAHERGGCFYKGHIDFGKRTITIAQQRRAGQGEPEPALKSAAAAGTFTVHPEVLTYLKRALLTGPGASAEERKRGRGRPRRQDIQQRYLFPYSQRDLDEILERCRSVAPEAFPEKDTGRGAGAFHVFRHSFGAMLEAAGTDISVARDLLRHAHVGTTQLYYQKMRGRKPDMSALERAWERQARAQGEAWGDGTVVPMKSGKVVNRQAG